MLSNRSWREPGSDRHIHERAWAFAIERSFVTRLGVGVTYFGAARIRLDVSQAIRSPSGPVEQIEAQIARASTFYGVVPYAGLLVGWRFQ